jgi:hypothetical protein
MPNEPCLNLEHIPTCVLDSDIGPRTDNTLIPPIDALTDTISIKDFAQVNSQGTGLKTEPDLEEGEILDALESLGGNLSTVNGGHIDPNTLYQTLMAILTQVAQHEPQNHNGSTRARSSTASTPPSASPHASSPSTHSYRDDSVNVYYIHPSMGDTDNDYDSMHTNLLTPPNSEARLSTIYEDVEDAYMPSLAPMQTFIPESNTRNDDNDNRRLRTPPPPYRGILRSEGRQSISFEGLMQHDAEAHLTTERTRYNDYHSVYIPNVANAIDSFNYCQDGLIALDWDMAQFQDGSYGGHPVIPGEMKLPTGGPRSPRTWHERVREIRDHRAHSRHLINVVETVLSTRMLAKASSQASIINCDHLLHIEGSLTPAVYKGQYQDVNPFFSCSESKHLNSYAAIAEHHGEPQLASKIIEALLMPYPDEDTVSALVESRLLDVGAVRDILRMALDRDIVLRIVRTGLHVIPTSPFYAESFENPFYSKKWYSVSDIFEDPVEEPKTKGKKFFL